MKFRVTMKDPDVLDCAISETLDGITIANIDLDEQDMIKEKRKKDILKICETWLEYEEYLTVEIDTDAKTCTVVPVGD